MRFYTKQHKHHCGIDLHARSMYLCIMDQSGEILLHRNLRANPEAFLKAVAPYREDLVVSVECMFTWYWLADLCRSEQIQMLRDLEYFILRTAKHHNHNTLYRLRTVPGIGKILSLVILYEIHDINRFERPQELASYARLVKCARESAGKIRGTGGRKIGNVHLKWAFSEAAVGFLRKNPDGKRYYNRLERKHGKGKALTVLAHKLARAVYYIWKKDKVFDQEKFLAA